MRRWGTAVAALALAGAGLTATAATAYAATPPTKAAADIERDPIWGQTPAGTDRDPIWGQGAANGDRDPIWGLNERAACDTNWGSGTKTAAPTEYEPLVNIRAGQHPCFDRLVFDIRGSGGKQVGYRVGYVNELRQDGSGDLIKVGGGAILDVHVAAPSYDPATGKPTYPGRAGQTLPGVNVSGFQTFKDTRYASSFEGDTQIGLGVRAKLPFRVTQTDNHLIVDVAHSWTATR
ncbi:hypothetical protein AAHZ94_23235 [Streptomyces sp. HSW2009]|uniref:AMIN-like domain-containing (lipo)protein n=1 Tax=Streptomyces sp. HSW2009 TaxID=3142890 RepID=UPI0032ED6F6E